jgi:hypothetical protein
MRKSYKLGGIIERVEVGVARVTKASKIRRLFRFVHGSLTDAKSAIFAFVLTFFISVNEEVMSKLPFFRLQEETSEHVNMLAKVFKYVILPASLVYVCTDFVFFRENALDSMLWGILVFCYGSFVPDLPSVFRNGKNEKLPWYKKYSLLLFAPLFIWMLFSGIRIGWKTAESFHNFRSLTVFGAFLLFLGFLAFGHLPVDPGDVTEILSLPLYGLTGYLSHLRVDKVL